MTIKILESEYPEIINKYLSGMSCIDISKLYNVKSTCIFDILKRTKTKVRSLKEACQLRKLTKGFKSPKWGAFEKEFVDLYNSGLSTVLIAKKYNTRSTIVRRILMKYIKLRTRAEAESLSIRFGRVTSKYQPLYPKIHELYKSGLTCLEISEKIGNITSSTVNQIIARTIGARSRSEYMKMAAAKGRMPTLLKKGDTREKSIRWLSDRSLLKEDRMHTEERGFFKEVIAERNYTCELTEQIGGKLSVHHIAPVWKNKKLQYTKSNVIVILRSIHQQFHKLYGFKSDQEDWKTFIKEKQYAIPKSSSEAVHVR